jgi:hypothetical protein
VLLPDKKKVISSKLLSQQIGRLFGWLFLLSKIKNPTNSIVGSSQKII